MPEKLNNMIVFKIYSTSIGIINQLDTHFKYCWNIFNGTLLFPTSIHQTTHWAISHGFLGLISFACDRIPFYVSRISLSTHIFEGCFVSPNRDWYWGRRMRVALGSLFFKNAVGSVLSFSSNFCIALLKRWTTPVPQLISFWAGMFVNLPNWELLS